MACAWFTKGPRTEYNMVCSGILRPVPVLLSVCTFSFHSLSAFSFCMLSKSGSTVDGLFSFSLSPPWPYFYYWVVQKVLKHHRLWGWVGRESTYSCCCCFLGTHRWTWTFRVMSNWRFEWPKPSLARCRTSQIATFLFFFLSFLLIRAAGHSVQAVAPLLILSDLKPLNWWDTFTYERIIYIVVAKNTLKGGLLLSFSIFPFFVVAGHLPSFLGPLFVFLFFSLFL